MGRQSTFGIFALKVFPVLFLFLPLLTHCGPEGLRFAFPDFSPQPSPFAAGERAIQITIPINAGLLGKNAFGINPRVIRPGTTVTWYNGDLVNHSVTSETLLWDSGIMAPGQSFQRKFDVPGVYPYYSKTTAAAQGTIEVTGTYASPTVLPGEPTPEPVPNTNQPGTVPPLPEPLQNS